MLIACAGSTYFDALRFYNSPTVGLGLLTGGVVGNLVISWHNRLSYAATFSMMLSYVALYFAPVTLIIQYISFITTLFSYAIISRKYSTFHLALIAAAYGIFNYVWAYQETSINHWFHFFITGSLLAMIPFGMVLRTQITCIEKVIPTVVSLLVFWGVLAIQTLLWIPYPLFIMLFFGGIGALVGFVALYYRSSIPRWWAQSHLLISMLYIGLSIHQLTQCNVNTQCVLGVFITELIIFGLLFSSIIDKIFTYFIPFLLIVSIGILGFKTLRSIGSHTEVLLVIKFQYFSTLVGILILFGGSMYLSRRISPHRLPLPFLWRGYYTILFALALYSAWFLPLYAFIGLVFIHCALARYLVPSSNDMVSIGLQITNLALLTGVALAKMKWGNLPFELGGICFVTTLIPFFGMLSPRVLQLPKEWEGRYDGWVYSLSGYILCSIVFLLKSFSDFLPGLLFLIIAVVLFELRHNLIRAIKLFTDKVLLMEMALHNVAIGMLFAFTVRHLTVHIQSHYFLIPYLSLSTALGFLGMVTCIMSIYQGHWLRLNKATQVLNLEYLTGKIFNYFVSSGYELFLIILLVTICLEVPLYLQVIVFALLTLGLAWFSQKLHIPPRIRKYTWIGFFLTSIHLAVVTSHWNSPLQSWYANTHITGLLGVLILFGVGNTLIQLSDTKKCDRPQTLLVLRGCIPVFILSALFLYWRFDQAYLTIMWVILCLFMIGTGLFWRNLRLIQVAYGALGICVVRLILFDLQEMDLFIRALVFITVGCLMIVTQIIHKKFIYRVIT